MREEERGVSLNTQRIHVYFKFEHDAQTAPALTSAACTGASWGAQQERRWHLQHKFARRTIDSALVAHGAVHDEAGCKARYSRGLAKQTCMQWGF